MPSLRCWHILISSGTANVLNPLCKVINTFILDFLLGRLNVVADVSLFNRAASIVNMVSKVIGPSISYFTLPYMARIHHTTGSVSAHFLRISCIIASMLFPVLARVAFMANDIVLLLLAANGLQLPPDSMAMRSHRPFNLVQPVKIYGYQRLHAIFGSDTATYADCWKVIGCIVNLR